MTWPYENVTLPPFYTEELYIHTNINNSVAGGGVFISGLKNQLDFIKKVMCLLKKLMACVNCNSWHNF